MRRSFFARVFNRKTSKWQDYPGASPAKAEETPENYTMFQGFEWYVPDDHKHWQRLRDAVPGLKAIGVDNVWIPPGCKASSPSGNGYDIYDLYDLGEFDQKGSRGTKWGTKEELVELINKANDVGVGVYWDAVLNHKAAADKTEKCRAVEVDPEDRNKEVAEAEEIEAWLGFDFPGRQDKYSSQKYHWYHFSGTDYNAANNKNAIYKLLGDGKTWSDAVDTEYGNYDYLMFADLDYSHPEVKDDVKKWGEWIGKELKIRGFRFDAIKHYSEDFLKEFIGHLDNTVGAGWFLVGEFWKTSLPGLTTYLDRMDHKFCLFDAPLVYKFSELSNTDNADMRKVFDDTLVKAEPYNAVTFVMNHDTQPAQALEAPIAFWFKPLGYALILLRSEGYPCLFYGDLYGIKGGADKPIPPSCGGKLPDLVLARKLYAYGEENDYFDQANCVGWVRRGTHDRPSGLACILSNAGASQKMMFVGEMHNGERWTDILGWERGEVVIDKKGFGNFTVGQRSVSVWVNAEAKGRERFGKFDANIYKQ